MSDRELPWDFRFLTVLRCVRNDSESAAGSGKKGDAE